MRLRGMVLAALAAFAGCAPPQATPHRPQTPAAAVPVETGRLLGAWHVAARLPNEFERDCVEISVAYGRRADGFISVLDQCRRRDGVVRVAEGRMRFAGADGEGKFKRALASPVWEDYWVLARGVDYSWAILGAPDGSTLWVLTRRQETSSAERAFYEEQVADVGYRPSDLVWAAR